MIMPIFLPTSRGISIKEMSVKLLFALFIIWQLMCIISALCGALEGEGGLIPLWWKNTTAIFKIKLF